MSQSFPDVIVIGAQKSGTTTLFHDISLVSGVYLAEKESGVLSRGSRSGTEIAEEYKRQFSGAREGDILVDVCADYSMYPRWPDVQDNVLALERQPKVIYILRDPVSRTLSQHRHDVAYGNADADLDRALLERPTLLETSRYAAQLTRWLEVVSRDSILVLRFEDYMDDRVRGLARVCEFIGRTPENLDPGSEAHNKSSALAIPSGWFRDFAASAVYRHIIRPVVPAGVRGAVTRLVSPSPPTPATPSLSGINYLVNQLRDDVIGLSSMLGEPVWWDLDRHLGDVID